MSSPRRILLVEDDPADARLALAVLQELKLADDLSYVGDGVAALEYVRGEGAFCGRPPGHPAVILLDLKLPRVNGFEVLAQLKADQRFRDIPVVVHTSSEQERDLRRAYELGANSYVVKSIDFATYASCLQSIGRYWTTINHPPCAVLAQPLLPPA